jgi:hypothetical protein
VASGPRRGQLLEVTPFPQDAAAELWPPHGHRAAQLVPALLIALEHPDKFAVAHLLLDMNLADPTSERRRRIEPQAAGSVRYVLDGLTFEVRAVGEGSRDATHLADDEEVVEAVSSVDVAQLPAIRDLWHRRLDVPVVALSHWSSFVALLVLPTSISAAYIYRQLRGRSFADAGRCPSCGYDLRASPERCPECGAAAVSRDRGPKNVDT